jgi:hypothetical protein
MCRTFFSAAQLWSIISMQGSSRWKPFVYKIQMQQASHGSDEARRGDFKVFLEDNPAVPQSMPFSD